MTEIADIAKLEPKPGDVIVVKLVEPLADEDVDAMVAGLKTHLPDGVKALVVDAGATVDVHTSELPAGVPIVAAGFGKGWPRVAGRCPACGRKSLFLASGGYVTCAARECRNPAAASDLLDPEPLSDDQMNEIIEAGVERLRNVWRESMLGNGPVEDVSWTPFRTPFPATQPNVKPPDTR